MDGNHAALATPMLALALLTAISACWMSGRRSSRSEGTPAGMTGGVGMDSSVMPRCTVPSMISLGERPSRASRELSAASREMRVW